MDADQAAEHRENLRRAADLLAQVERPVEGDDGFRRAKSLGGDRCVGERLLQLQLELDPRLVRRQLFEKIREYDLRA